MNAIEKPAKWRGPEEQRNRNTAAATAANIARKHRRWAEELRAAGWTVREPEGDEEQ